MRKDKRNAWLHVDSATLVWIAWAMRYFRLGSECHLIGERVARHH